MKRYIGWSAIGLVAVFALVFWWQMAKVWVSYTTALCHDPDDSGSVDACWQLETLNLVDEAERARFAFHHGRAKLEWGSSSEAIQLLEEAMTGGEDGPEVHFAHGRALQNNVQHRAAAQAFTRALSRGHDDTALAWRGWSRLFFDDEGALADFDQVAKHHPAGEPVIWVQEGRAWALRDMGRDVEALAAFRTSADTNDYRSYADQEIVDILLDLNLGEEALAAVNGNLLQSDEDGDAWVQRGTALMLLGRHGEARADFQRAAEADWGYEAYLGLGHAHLALGQDEDARRAYLQAIASEPKELPAQLAIVMLDCKSGDVAAARERLAKLYKLQPALAWLAGAPERIACAEASDTGDRD
ncbi:MAG: tetratricopeptide repeat protein [Pseudomonadota bacterium]